MTNKKYCCGCTACVHICPVKCITMREDGEGFLYPAVDSQRCIGCRKCDEVCPARSVENGNTETDTYICYNRDDKVRKQSSSGGVFSLLSEWVIKQNGAVFGAAFGGDFEVCHIAAETEEELSKLRGSKYVQSRLEDAYPLAKKYLENKSMVLFSGTACQIAGLKKYLGREYENLYTVDVLCHGVPSLKIWRMYLDDLKNRYGADIEKIEFRNKQNGWKNFCMNIEFADNQRYSVLHRDDEFMQMFLGNIDLRQTCYNCRFKDLPRISDMTIGDSWGVEGYMPDMDDDGGTSVVYVHSPKGRQMLDEIREFLNLREASLDKVLTMTDVRKSVKKHPNRKKFFAGLERGEDINTLHGYLKKSFLQKAIGFPKYCLWRLLVFFKGGIK